MASPLTFEPELEGLDPPGKIAFLRAKLDTGTPVEIAGAAHQLGVLGATEALPRLYALQAGPQPTQSFVEHQQSWAVDVAIARLTPDRAAELIPGLADRARFAYAHGDVIALITERRDPGLARVLLAKLSDPSWLTAPWKRFDLIDALGVIGYPEHAAMLEAIWRSPTESTWHRLAAAIRLVRGRPNLAAPMTALLRTAEGSTDPLTRWFIRGVGESVLGAIWDAAVGDPARELAALQLCDDVRRGRLYFDAELLAWYASDVIHDVVDSPDDDAYERWRAERLAFPR